MLPREARRLQSTRRATTSSRSILDLTHLPEGDAVPQACRHPRDLRKVRRRRSVREPDARVPRRPLFSMGGLVGRLRAHRGKWLTRPRKRRATSATNIEGLYADGRMWTTSTTARIASAPTHSLSCIFGRNGDGPVDGQLPQQHGKTSGYDRSSKSTFDKAEKRERDKVRRHLLKLDGKENPYGLHKELGDTMLLDVHDRAPQRTSSTRSSPRSTSSTDRAKKVNVTRLRPIKSNQRRAVRSPLEQHVGTRPRHRPRRTQS